MGRGWLYRSHPYFVQLGSYTVLSFLFLCSSLSLFRASAALYCMEIIRFKGFPEKGNRGSMFPPLLLFSYITICSCLKPWRTFDSLFLEMTVSFWLLGEYEISQVEEKLEAGQGKAAFRRFFSRFLTPIFLEVYMCISLRGMFCYFWISLGLNRIPHFNGSNDILRDGNMKYFDEGILCSFPS